MTDRPPLTQEHTGNLVRATPASVPAVGSWWHQGLAWNISSALRWCLHIVVATSCG